MEMEALRAEEGRMCLRWEDVREDSRVVSSKEGARGRKANRRWSVN